MIGVMFIYMYVTATIASGADWEEENMTWDEDKQEFVFTEKKDEDKKKDNKNRDEDGWVIGGKRNGATNPPPPQRATRPQHSWERYLPNTVRLGKREATQWEITEAQRKHWAKGVQTQRAMAKSQQRANLIAYRKATGWYAQRRAGPGNGIANMHIQAVSNYVNSGGGYGYANHSPSCAPRVHSKSYGYAHTPPIRTYSRPVPQYTNGNRYPTYSPPPAYNRSPEDYKTPYVRQTNL